MGQAAKDVLDGLMCQECGAWMNNTDMFDDNDAIVSIESTADGQEGYFYQFCVKARNKKNERKKK